MEDLKETARQIRIKIVKMLHKAKSGHTGGSLGMTDIFTALYFGDIINKNIFSKNEDRDRFILSNGHICPVWYATLAQNGYLKDEELMTLRDVNSRLEGHPVNHGFDVVELPTGSLGQGISAAVGLAYGYKMDNKKSNVFVGLGDGEMNEGSVWEALMAGAHYKLDNLIAFVDRNHIQQGGKTEDMMKLDPLNEKVKAFGWNVIETDGHDFDSIKEAFNKAKENKNGPSFIIFKTHIGKGVSFMEDGYEWHGMPPNDDQLQKALIELGEGGVN
jgi:transketolase